MHTYIHLPARIGPGTELHLALLVIKGKPSDVNLASGFEDTRRDIKTVATAVNYNLGLKSPVETFFSAGKKFKCLSFQKQIIGKGSPMIRDASSLKS